METDTSSVHVASSVVAPVTIRSMPDPDIPLFQSSSSPISVNAPSSVQLNIPSNEHIPKNSAPPALEASPDETAVPQFPAAALSSTLDVETSTPVYSHAVENHHESESAFGSTIRTVSVPLPVTGTEKMQALSQNPP